MATRPSVSASVLSSFAEGSPRKNADNPKAAMNPSRRIGGMAMSANRFLRLSFFDMGLSHFGCLVISRRSSEFL